MAQRPQQPPHAVRPWYKEPWPWILMAGPMLAMVGCGITIWLASTHADVPVRDATRHGLVVAKADVGSATEQGSHP